MEKSILQFRKKGHVMNIVWSMKAQTHLPLSSRPVWPAKYSVWSICRGGVWRQAGRSATACRAHRHCWLWSASLCAIVLHLLSNKLRFVEKLHRACPLSRAMPELKHIMTKTLLVTQHFTSSQRELHFCSYTFYTLICLRNIWSN